MTRKTVGLLTGGVGVGMIVVPMAFVLIGLLLAENRASGDFVVGPGFSIWLAIALALTAFGASLFWTSRKQGA